MVSELSAVLTAALDITLKVSLIMVLAGVVTLALRRSTASLRHLVWSMALAAALIIPVLAIVMPGISVPGLGRVLDRVHEPMKGVAPDFEVVAAGVGADAPAEAPTVRSDEPWPHVAGAWSTEKSTSEVQPADEECDEAAVDPKASSDDASWNASATATASVEPHMIQPSLSPSAADLPANSAALTQADRIPWALWLFLIWGVGTLLLLARFLSGIVRTRQLARSASVAREGRLVRAVSRAARALRISRPITVLVKDGPAMPMTWGAVKPKVLLPREAHGWPEDRLSAVVLHELAHVKRNDWLAQLVARFACVIHWFNPLVWLAAARLRHERELACDDHVLRAGSRASDYAGYLLDVARRLRAGTLAAQAGVAMARSSRLGARMRALLDAGRERRALRWRDLIPAWLVAALITIPIALATAESASDSAAAEDEVGWESIPSESESSWEESAPSSEVKAAPVSIAFDRPSIQPVFMRIEPWLIALSPELHVRTVRLPSPAVEAVPFPVVSSWGRELEPALLCDWGLREHGRHSSSVNVNDEGKLKARIQRDDCELKIEATGRFEVNGAETEVTSLEPGGRIDIQEKRGRAKRRLLVESSESGELKRRWYVDGKERPFDGEARAWVAEMLPTMFRVTGLDAEARALRVLTNKGTDGLMREIALISSDHTASHYYGVLLTQGNLGNSDYRRIINQAADEISSDHSLANLLIAISETSSMDEYPVILAYIDASERIDSDHDQARALKAILGRPGLSQQGASEMLRRATAISSDHQLANLLMEYLATQPSNEPLPPEFFSAVETINSNHDRGRVLGAVLSRGSTSPEVFERSLEAAAEMGSDHELSKLLQKTAAIYPAGRDLPTNYYDVARSIGSDNELGNVLGSVVQREPLSTQDQLNVLEAAREIGSDHELAKLLGECIATKGLNDVTREPYFETLGTIGSDHSHARVLHTLIATGSLSDDDIAAVLGSSLRIGSDHEVSKILVAIAETYDLSGELRDAYVKVADSVSSEHEKNRALAAIVR